MNDFVPPNWTPEAREHLDGYLAQVRALARQNGDDADDIAAELRNHIEREVNAAAGTLVTLEHLRTTLNTVGTPDQVASADSLLAPPSAPPRLPTATPEATIPPAPIPPAPAPRKPFFRFGCCLAICLCFLAAFALAVLIPFLNYQRHFTQSLRDASEKEAVARLFDIYAKEHALLKDPTTDTDGDKIPDYQPLPDLKDGENTPGTFNGIHANYAFSLQVTPSASNGGTPAFTANATATSAQFPHNFSIDQSGELKTTSTPP